MSTNINNFISDLVTLYELSNAPNPCETSIEEACAIQKNILSYNLSPQELNDILSSNNLWSEKTVSLAFDPKERLLAEVQNLVDKVVQNIFNAPTQIPLKRPATASTFSLFIQAKKPKAELFVILRDYKKVLEILGSGKRSQNEIEQVDFLIRNMKQEEIDPVHLQKYFIQHGIWKSNTVPYNKNAVDFLFSELDSFKLQMEEEPSEIIKEPKPFILDASELMRPNEVYIEVDDDPFAKFYGSSNDSYVIECEESPIKRPSYSRFDTKVQKICAGFENFGVDCAFNALLQVAVSTPWLKDVFIGVAHDYIHSPSFEILKILETPSSTNEEIDEALESVKELDRYHQLLTLQAILESDSMAKEIVERIQKEVKIDIALSDDGDLKATIACEMTNYKNPNGSNFAEEILTVHTEHTQRGEPVSSFTSHNFREKIAEMWPNQISPQNRQEDAWEILLLAMGRYQEVLVKNGIFPSLPFFGTELKMFYKESATPPPSQSPEKDLQEAYSSLQADNSFILQKEHDFQIALDIQHHEELKFEELLSHFFEENCEGSEEALFLDEDSNLKKYEPVKRQNKFDQLPPHLTLVVKRFFVDSAGIRQKITKPVEVPLIMTLPAHSTSENREEQYALKSFIVHLGSLSGGHYIAIKQVEGKWLLCNDANVTEISEEEVLKYFKGEVNTGFGTATSYLHFYDKI